MDPTATITRLGFRKWYERELIKSHAALVTCFLCGILIAALVETLNFREFGWRPLSMMLLIAGTAVLGWSSWRAYITVLKRAEVYGERSSCPNPECLTYGRFDVLSSGVDSVPSASAQAVAPLDYAWMQVKCRKCGTGWRMPE